MPIRQNILRKGKAPKQNLLQFDVFQEETGVLGDITTSQFFNISDFPSVLPTGNSSFLIEGSDLLKPEVELKTEILDAEGNPIFHYAIPGYDKELPARRIAVEVYRDDVVNGVGTLTILGELDPKQFNIPIDFQDTYNVRFTAPISINKTIKNTEAIRFYGDPTISVSELVKGVAETVSSVENLTKTITGSVEAIVDKTTIVSTTPNTYIPDVQKFEEVGNSLQKYKSKNLSKNKQSSILPQTTTITKRSVNYILKELESSNDNPPDKLSSALAGATITFQNPNLTAKDSSNQSLSDTDFTLPTTFETDVLNIENSTTFTTTTDYIVTDKSTNQNQKAGLNPTIVTMSFETKNVGVVESQVFKRSFANMTVGNLQTFSGDTYKAKIYMKEDGSSGEFEPIYETLVESQNELVDIGSISGFDGVGTFATQSTIDNNWVTSSNLASASTNDDTILDGVLLSGSNAGVGDTFTFVTKDVYSLQKNQPYLVEFKTAAKHSDKTQTDGTTNKEAKLEVFLTGPIVSEIGEEFSLGDVDLSDIDLSSNEFVELNKLQIADFLSHNLTSSPSGSLGFRVHAGEFILSDIRLRPFSETNFSPGFFKANVPMPAPIKRGQKYDFLVEFYDANNNLAEAVAIADDVVFQGPPQIIADGADGLLTGSLFLGNLTGSGIELHGGSAYMRSIGYDGFNDTISNNVGGFLIFSGSVSESMGTTEDYEGVGLEIVDAHGDTDRFLKFRTNPSEFTVQTDQFFLGKEGQFISGSNGNIVISSSNFFLGGESTFVSGSNDKLEISSSNFHLDDDGSVIMQGTITAEAGGTIGGFTIGSSSISKDNVLSISSSTNIEDPASFISSSAFKVSAGGIITGSNILLTGGTITSGVTVEGTFSANSILTPATIAGSPTTVANASASIDANGNAVFRSGSIGGFNMDGTTLFSDSAEFVVTGSTGQITGSQVLFTGGKIGGFDIDAISIASSNGNLIMSSSGQITASAADLTGDLNATHIKASSGSIGGFVLDTEFINSVDGNISINSADKAIRISNNTFGNTGIQLEHNSGTPRAHIGKSDGEGFKFDGTNVVMSSSAFLLGSRAAGKSFVSGSNGEIEISGSAFHLLKGNITASNVDLSGKITADSGEIGGFSITENAISSSNNELILRGAGAGTSAGQITGSRVLFSGGEIGGFLITDNTIETKDFVSGLKGIRLSTADNGSLEVEEAKIRGTLSTTVFEKESINAVGGQLVVANSTVITGSSVFPTGSFGSTDTTMSVANSSGFVNGEILILKKVTGTGFTTEYVQVDSASRLATDDNDLTGLLMVTRSLNDNFEPGKHSGSLSEVTASAQSYEVGQVVVSTGRLGTGYIRLNANPSDTTTPYIDIVERTGSKVFEVDLKARLGDLSGLSSALVGSSPGFGLFSQNVFLTGKITATSGTIANWDIDGNKLESVNASNKGIILDADPSSPTIEVRENDNNRIRIFHTTNNDFGLIGTQGGNNVFLLGDPGGQGNRIAGWSFDNTTIKNGTDIQLDSSNKKITINDQTFGNTGIQLEHNSGTPRAFIGKSTAGFLKFDGTDLEVSSSNFILGTSGSGAGAYVSASNNKLRISSSAFDLDDDGTFNFANGKLTFDSSGELAIDGTATIGGNAGSDLQTDTEVNNADKTSGTVGGWTITSNTIKSNSNKIILHQNNGVNGQIKVGDATSISAGDGVYLDGTGDFRVGDADGERIQFDLDGDDVLILSASNFKLGNQTSFVSGSQGNVKISGSSIDLQTPAFVLGDLDSSFVSGSNGKLSMGADTFTLSATGSNNTGIIINSAQASILATGSNSITDANSVILNGSDGVIEVSQSAIGIFDTGRTAVFTKNTIVEPAVFKIDALPEREFLSSSAEITRPVPTADNLNVISSSKMNRLETQQLYMDTAASSVGEGSLTPFFYVDKGAARLKNTGINSASSVVFSSQKNLTGLSHTDRSLPPEFVFSSEYFTVPIETPGEFGFVNNSENSGSSIFTITTKVSGSNHTSATGDTNDFTDAKFNILALEADTRGLPNARKSEFTFLQAKASSSIMFQLQHDGDVVSRGNLTAFGTSFLTVSDKREKKNIYQISESLDKVLELRPTKFTWKETDKEDVGFIAQEVEEIIPEVVETTKGFIDIDNEKQPEERKTISYPKLVPYLVDTIKELTKRIEELEKKVK